MEGFTTQTLGIRLFVKAKILTNQDVKLYTLSNSYYDFMFSQKFFQDLNWYVNKKA